MSLRALPQCIEYNAQLKFGSIVSYTVDHPVKDIESENYFLPCQHYLGSGDEIRVSLIRDDGTWDKAVFEVTTSSQNSVVVERVVDWRHGGVLVMRGMKAVHKGFGKWAVQDDSGKQIAQGLTKAEAHSFVSNVQPKKDEQAA